MKKLLQKILFPKDERLQVHWGLFYRAPRLALNADCTELHLARGTAVDFATYLNGFSLQKWKLYTNVKHITLNLSIQGHFVLNAVGYHLNPMQPDRHEFSSREYTFEEATEVSLPFPDDTAEQLLSFEILPLSDCVLLEGAFYGEFDEKDVRDVTLCLATTTMKKEEFIKKNVALLKEELLSEKSEIRDNFYVHVVDNGRTLSKEEIEGYHVALHPNKNVGGSGGFARGMIESLHQTPQATHVLLMDDDVLVLPESIRRTYTLLTVLKEEWQEAFVSGAMLKMNEPYLQAENGAVWNKGNILSLNKNRDVRHLENCIYEEKITAEYNAWWYCCFSIGITRNDNFPLPIFIRGDDVEWGLRNMENLILMNGICVWHESFENKTSAWLQYYNIRNKMIINSIHLKNYSLGKVFDEVRHQSLHLFRNNRFEELNSYINGIFDFLKGCDWFYLQDGEILHQRIFEESNQPMEKSQLALRCTKLGLNILFRFNKAKKSFKKNWRKLCTLDFWEKYLKLGGEK